ncbi:MAG: Asparagine synthetase (glutamine-hydrolyzing) 3 [Bacteroidetes bacterium ADurb.Bin408]|nr:MAG: Asparagine synthetase (glutamine-hydrolyzing) 3 [Bacteroidetes bacterium ADurb.Bin408]
MCGICGIFDQSAGPDERRLITDKMLSAQMHRGPDGSFSWHEEGGVSLGHNRLKIIDLSDEANQPMEKDGYIIAFNGEVYNYVELKEILVRRGYTFRTTSDTEVILAAYMEWGSQCVEQFVGMWAFVIWDKEKRALFCSRDRFGIKPFYYILKDCRFYFASEYKSLKQTPLFDNKLNTAQFNRGIMLGWMSYNDETYFDCIKQLPPATNLVVTENQFNIKKYWDLSRDKTLIFSGDEKYFVFYEMFKESINIHLRSDVVVGGCLSGGLDSSSIASMICKHNPEVNFKTFSIYYEGGQNVDERDFIREVVKMYPNITPFYHTPNDKSIEESFDDALYYADVPFADSSYMSQYFLMQLAAKNKVIVLIDGQGADEYLAGYMHSFYRLIADYLKAFRLREAIMLTGAQNRRQEFDLRKKMLFILKTLFTLTNNEQHIYRKEFERAAGILSSNSRDGMFTLPSLDNNDKFHSFLYNLIFYTSLPSLLHYVDRNSMRFSIESRVPFLDHRLVEFIFSLPKSDKINRSAETKYILRRGLKSILPTAVSERKDKKGFVTPGDTQWLRGPLKKLLDIDYTMLPEFDNKKTKALINNFRKGDNSHSKLIWKLAIAAYWLKANKING